MTPRTGLTPVVDGIRQWEQLPLSPGSSNGNNSRFRREFPDHNNSADSRCRRHSATGLLTPIVAGTARIATLDYTLTIRGCPSRVPGIPATTGIILVAGVPGSRRKRECLPLPTPRDHGDNGNYSRCRGPGIPATAGIIPVAGVPGFWRPRELFPLPKS